MMPSMEDMAPTIIFRTDDLRQRNWPELDAIPNTFPNHHR
jgi:hypothetical protein